MNTIKINGQPLIETNSILTICTPIECSTYELNFLIYELLHGQGILIEDLRSEHFYSEEESLQKVNSLIEDCSEYNLIVAVVSFPTYGYLYENLERKSSAAIHVFDDGTVYSVFNTRFEEFKSFVIQLPHLNKEQNETTN